MIGASRFNRSVGDHKTPFMAGKERELFESKKWPSLFSRHVDITKVRIDAFKPWINKRITELMGVEDDIVVDYCISQLKVLGETDAKANTENAGDGGTVLNEKPYLDPKKLQINLTGFMAKKAHVFVKELWELLLSAQENEYGIPQKFIDEKRREIGELENNVGLKTEVTELGADTRIETDCEKARHESPGLSSRRDDNLTEKRARTPSSDNVWYKDKKYTESLRNPNRRYNRYSKYNRYRRSYNRYSRSKSSSSSRSSDYRRNRRRRHSRSNSPYYRKHSNRRRYSSPSSSLTPERMKSRRSVSSSISR